MRFLTLSLFLGLAGLTLAQEPFERILTMPGALYIAGVAQDAEDHFVIASVNEGDLQVTRLSPTGDHLWTNKYPKFTEEGLYGNGIAVGPEGILVVGYTMGLGTNSRDGIILRIGLDGTLLDTKRVDAGVSNAFHQLKATPDGFIATGRSDAAGNLYDMSLAKLDHSGNVQWMRTYGTTAWDWAYQATQLADGGYAMVGYGDALGTGFSPSGYLVRTDATGNELWARSISSGTGVDEAYSIMESSTGDLYIGGRSLGYISGDVTAFITKLSSTGSHVWTRTMEQGIETVAMTPAPNGGVNWLAHPQYVEGGLGGYELAWGTFSADGTLLNSKIWGGTGSDNGTAMFNMEDGGVSILGFTNSGTATWSGMLIRTDADLNAACNNIDLVMEWTEDEAIVTPFTSLPGAAFESFAYTVGTEAVAVSSFNPCCSVSAAFEATNDQLEWTFTNTSEDADTYLWEFGDGNVSEEESPQHLFHANGLYTVCLTAYGACGEATTCQQITIAVGINDLQGETDLEVFPSPAQGMFTVRVAGQRIQQIELIDGAGRSVLVLSALNTLRVEVPVDGLAQGIYSVRATLDNSVRVIDRVVVH